MLLCGGQSPGGIFCFEILPVIVLRNLNTKRMEEVNYLKKLSPSLFWDIDISRASMETCPQQVVQRVLEYGNMDDWRFIRAYYGLPRIVELCKQMRTLDPVCLSYICLLSGTSKEEYRCYHTAQSNPTLWNS